MNPDDTLKCRKCTKSTNIMVSAVTQMNSLPIRLEMIQIDARNWLGDNRLGDNRLGDNRLGDQTS